MAKKAQGTETKQNSVYHVRLPETARNALKKAATGAGRTLMGEMEHRLVESCRDLPRAVDPAAYGWSAPQRAQALGAALGVLAGRIFDYSAPMTGAQDKDQGVALAMMRVTFDEILVALGAAPIEEPEKQLAHGAATSFLRDLERVVPDPAQYGTRPELAAVANLKKAFEQGPSQK